MEIKNFKGAMEFRYACKLFDENQKISDSDMRYILEMGRLSPSSFGMEGWKFLVITNQELKEKLKPLCWNQPQITTCSHLVVVLAGINCLKPSSGVPQKRFARRDLPQEQIENYLKVYSSHLADTLSSDDKIYEWSARQAYIASTNMMVAGASIGIDSCPIEGMERAKVEEVLNLDRSEYQIAMLLPFGYRVGEQSPRLRLSYDEVVEFL